GPRAGASAARPPPAPTRARRRDRRRGRYVVWPRRNHRARAGRTSPRPRPLTPFLPALWDHYHDHSRPPPFSLRRRRLTIATPAAVSSSVKSTSVVASTPVSGMAPLPPPV